jgi:hypothetical protein
MHCECIIIILVKSFTLQNTKIRLAISLGEQVFHNLSAGLAAIFHAQEWGKGERTAFERAAPNGAAPEKRTCKDDMSYLSTTGMIKMSNTTGYIINRLTGMPGQ